MGWRIKQRPARIGGVFRNNQGDFVGFSTKLWFEDAKANFSHVRTEKKPHRQPLLIEQCEDDCIEIVGNGLSLFRAIRTMYHGRPLSRFEANPVCEFRNVHFLPKDPFCRIYYI
jgi:hypothetical protein